MLELRPNCELCDCDLPPASTEARICTYECTFCADCVVSVLHDVCPNCGGGFERRPIRPSVPRRDGTGLPHHPASTQRVHRPTQRDELAAFVAGLREIAPGDR